MEKTSCYSITVKKFNVFCRHTDWLRQTQELYNEILGFYYELYLDTFIDSTPGAMEALRTLEKMTIIGRDKQPVPNPLPWTKVRFIFAGQRLMPQLQQPEATVQEKHRTDGRSSLQSP